MYRCAYRLVSVGCILLQFVAIVNDGSCSTFQSFAVRFSSFARTFNPKLDEHALILRDQTGADRRVPFEYAAEHLHYGYALTGHAAQGLTIDRASVLLHDHGALQEWGYVACSRARLETRLYLADPDQLERETPLREPDPAAPPDARPRPERSAAEPLALDQADHGRRQRAPRPATGRTRTATRPRSRTARSRTARAQTARWWSRGDRRFELRRDRAPAGGAPRLDEKRAELERTPPRAPRLTPPTRGDDELTPTRSRRQEPPGRRTLEREPPGLGLEL